MPISLVKMTTRGAGEMAQGVVGSTCFACMSPSSNHAGTRVLEALPKVAAQTSPGVAPKQTKLITW